MKNIFFIIVFASFLASCATPYNIKGSSSIASLDGNKLYLRVVKDNEMKVIDSCAVVHGKFQFSGTLDTVKVASLYLDNEGIMPIILEKGEITIRIDNSEQIVSGTPYNEQLYEFINKRNLLQNKLEELSRKHIQMILDGEEESTINNTLSAEAAFIARDMDELETSFIAENYDNVLGPCAFMLITNNFRYPILTPQIEHIMSNATDKFKADSYVKDYYQTAQENENRMLGVENAHVVLDEKNNTETKITDKKDP